MRSDRVRDRRWWIAGRKRIGKGLIQIFLTDMLFMLRRTFFRIAPAAHVFRFMGR
jgi:hypothetical protein